MMHRRLTAALILICALSTGCTDKVRLRRALQSFQVTFTDFRGGQQTGTPAEPLNIASGTTCQENPDCVGNERCIGGNCSLCFSVDVGAWANDGTTMDWDGVLSLDVTPGHLADTHQFTMADGEALGVEVCLNRATEATHIWVEHNGFVFKPATKPYGQCNDGVDNDGNGLIDLADAGCLGIQDDLEAPVTMATGISPTVFFKTPSIIELQTTDSIRTSPFVGEEIRVDRGALLVTNVIGNGFYVTDMDATGDRPFNSTFVFTFSQPRDVRLGHLVCWVAGGVQEHVGHTQIIFPSFLTFDPKDDLPDLCGRDDIDDEMLELKPAEAADGSDLTERLVDEEGNTNTQAIGANSELLETWESGLVKLHNISVSERFIACDRDENGVIDKGTDEDLCRNGCQADPLCTDMEGYFEYHQWRGVVDGRKTMSFSRALAARFSPLAVEYLGQEDQQGLCTRHETALGFLEYLCPTRVLLSVTGSLRHIYLCNSKTGKNSCPLQFWVLDPRFDADITVPQDLDQDGDGYAPQDGDCDDNNRFVNPTAIEIVGNARDDDCDGVTK